MAEDEFTPRDPACRNDYLESQTKAVYVVLFPVAFLKPYTFVQGDF